MYYANVKKTYNKTAVKKRETKSFNIITVLLILLLLLTVFLVINSQGSRVIEYNIVTVKNGDTLWSIANRYNHDNQDIRRLVNIIKQINQLETVILQPGQEIKIPK